MLNPHFSFNNRRAISPVIATLILVAIAVMGGIMTFIFTNGFLERLTANEIIDNTMNFTRIDCHDYANGNRTLFMECIGDN